MRLFDIIPNNLFNIFYSENRDIYAEALLAIWKGYKNSSYILSRDECATILYTHFDSKLLEYQDENADGSADGTVEEKSMAVYAKKILRNLIRYGWIEENDELEELETYISIPVYSSEILEAITNILEPNNYETDKCVTNVYLNMKEIGIDSQNDWLFLLNAYQNTQKLNRLLQDMLHNMKMFYNNLLKQITISNLFKEHFDEYIDSMVYRKYHSLKTEDNLFKFRTEIVKKANELLYNDNTQNTITNQLMKKNNVTHEEALDSILIYLDEIKDTFETIDSRIQQVDRKHTQYLRATIDRMNYLKNREKDFKGNLIRVIKNLADSESSDRHINAINDNLSFNYMKVLSQSSYYKIPIKKAKFNPQPLQIDTNEFEDMIEGRNKVIDQQKAKESYLYSEKFVYSFLQEKFGDNNTINTRDFILRDDSEFIKLILALRLTRKKNAEFYAEVKDNYIINNNYKIPEIIIGRKK